MSLRAFVVLLCSVCAIEGTKPVVLWHGMGDSCCNPLSLGKIVKIIQDNTDDVYVKSLRIGSDMIEDIKNGFFMNANDQVKMACDMIASDPELRDGYNGVGFSQGGQFLRAVAQRCPTPQMHNLITLGSQHQGVYGLPHCFYPQHKYCDYVRKLLNKGAYWSWVQNGFVQAEFWHDPLDEGTYREKSIFIADINNEKERATASYATNLNLLSNFVMVKFEGDTMVEPVDSEWFGFYEPGQALNVSDFRNTRIYKEDLLGLKQMEADGKLTFLSVPGDHLQFSEEWFIETIINSFLKDK